MRKLITNKRFVFALCAILVGLSIAAIFAFDSNIDYSDLDSFEFILEFGPYGDSVINTFDNTLTNAYYNPENYVDFQMPKRIKRDIFKIMIQLEIMGCGNYLSYGVYDYQHPLSYTFQVLIGDEKKTIYWSVPWELTAEDISNLSNEQSRFLSFANYIINYLRGTKEYKNLPKPTRSYL